MSKLVCQRSVECTHMAAAQLEESAIQVMEDERTVARHRNRVDQPEWKLVRKRHLDETAVGEPGDAVVGAHPDTTARILEHRRRVIARQTVGLVVLRAAPTVKADESFRGCHPYASVRSGGQ